MQVWDSICGVRFICRQDAGSTFCHDQTFQCSLRPSSLLLSHLVESKETDGWISSFSEPQAVVPPHCDCGAVGWTRPA